MSEDFLPGPYVTRQIARLLGKEPSAMSPAARGMLAQLRHAAVDTPGTNPAVWAITSEGIPEDLGRTNRDTLEFAIHTALTHFAVHQQSRSTSMHLPGQRFGRAIRLLAEQSRAGDQEVHETPVYRRFSAMSSATSWNAVAAQARGLIGQLRAAEIPFDYGRYANDLYWLVTPGCAADVHRGWGRDFHTTRRIDTTTSMTITNEGDEK